jgi:hypothetical protein
VTALVLLSNVERMMRVHAEVCPGFAPSHHETPERSTSAEDGVTPVEVEGRSSGEGSGRGE